MDEDKDKNRERFSLAIVYNVANQGWRRSENLTKNYSEDQSLIDSTEKILFVLERMISRGYVLSFLFIFLREHRNKQESGIYAISSLGIALKNDEKFFDWLFKRLTVSMKDKKFKVYYYFYYRIIFQYLKMIPSPKKVEYIKCIKKLLTEIIKLLDNVDQSQQFKSLLDILEKVNKEFNSLLVPFFPDIVDVLIGWYLDIETFANIRSKITSSFLMFSHLWNLNEEFSCSLLEKLIKDIKIQEGGKEISNYVSCVRAIIRSCGKSFSNVAPKLVRLMIDSFTAHFPEVQKTPRLGKDMNECIISSCKEIKGNPRECVGLFCDYFESQLNDDMSIEEIGEIVKIVKGIMDIFEDVEIVKPVKRSFVRQVEEIAFRMIENSFEGIPELRPFYSSFLNQKSFVSAENFFVYMVENLFEGNEVKSLGRVKREDKNNITVLYNFSMMLYAINNGNNAEQLAHIIFKNYQRWFHIVYFLPDTFAVFIYNIRSKVKGNDEVVIPLIKILQGIVNSRIKLEILCWIEDIVKRGKVNEEVYSHLINAIRYLIRDRDWLVRLKSYELISYFVPKKMFMYEITNIVLGGVFDKNEKIWGICLGLLIELSPFFLDSEKWNMYMKWKKANALSVKPFSSFTPKFFTIFFDMIAKNKSDKKTLERLFLTSKQVDVHVNPCSMSKEYLEDWVTSSLSRFCVSNSLRTPFGNAFKTFKNFEETCESIVSDPQKYESKLFTQFMDNLEKEIHMLNQGILVPIANYPSSAKNFFHQNSKVTTMWFDRLRPLIVKSCFASGMSSSLIRNGMMNLNDLGNDLYSARDFEKAKRHYDHLEDLIVVLSKTLIKTGDSDTIDGISYWFLELKATALNALKNVSEVKEEDFKWMERKFSTFHDVIKGLFVESLKRYETSLLIYEKIVPRKRKYISPNTMQFIIDRIIMCYTNLCDMEGLFKFEEKLSKNREEDEPVQDFSYYHYLSDFDNGKKYNGEKTFNFIEEYERNSFSIYKLVESSPDIKDIGKLLRETAEKIKPSFRILDSCLSFEEVFPKFVQVYSLNVLSALSEKKFENVLEYLKKNSYSRYRGNFFLHLKRLTMRYKKEIGVDLWEKFEQKLIVSQCKLARKRRNFSFAKKLLGQIKDPLVAKFEEGRIRISGKEYNEAIDLFCKELNSNKHSNQKIMKKMLLKLESLSHIDLLKRKKIAKMLNEKEENLDEVLLKKAIEISESKKIPILTYAEWCMSECQRIYRKTVKDKFDLNEEEKEDVLKCFSGDDSGDNIINKVTNSFYEMFKDTYNQKINTRRYSLSSYGPEIQEKLNAVWYGVKKRLFSNFHFLGISNLFKALNMGLTNADEGIYENSTRITLSLLQYFVRFGELEEVIFRGIESSSPVLWYNTIPQLLSLLGNQERYVKYVKQILFKIGEKKPEILAFPVIVGTLSKKDPNVQYSELFKEMLVNSEEILTSVELFIRELTRITWLYEELWLTNISSIVKKFKKQYRLFKAERLKIKASELSENEKTHLVKGKYTHLMRSVIVELESSLKLTTQTPVTKHEHEFQQNYEAILNFILKSIKNPLEYEKIDEEKIVTTLTKLQKTFRKVVYQKGVLKLNDISPNLIKLRSSCVPIPGCEMDDEYPTVESFSNVIEVLSSKTKPKKIFIIGSDGMKYKFLLKGKEDLHLDERVMQFLRIANVSLRSNKTALSKKLHARHYSVIPLGDRSGLIRWVEDTTSIFDLYRLWHRQQREKMKDSLEGSKTFRPVDRFFNKLIPLLKKRGIKNISHPYPLDVVNEVMAELRKETPKDLLAKEIWFSSKTLDDWWEKIRSFNRSYGVMSIIGYIIGLGDRHLDNILVDFFTGDVVHIDYNVCFDKGLQLRIPEVVPFRMTPIIQNALGVTSISGMFRIACETTLYVMRKSRKTLMKLLEAFIYDPLVDWTADKSNDIQKLTLNVSLNLVSSRIKEMDEFMNQVYDNTISKMDSVESSIAKTYSLVEENSLSFLKFNESANKFDEFEDEIKEIAKLKPEYSRNINVIGMKFQEVYVKQGNAKSFLENLLVSYSKLNKSQSEVLDLLINKVNYLNEVQSNTFMDTTILKSPQLNVVITGVFNQGEVNIKSCIEVERLIEKFVATRNERVETLFNDLKEYQNYVSNYQKMEYFQKSKSFKWGSCISNILQANSIDAMDKALKILEDPEKEKIFDEEKLKENHELIDKEMNSLKNDPERISFLEKALNEIQKNLFQFIKNFPEDKKQVIVAQFVICELLSMILNGIQGEKESKEGEVTDNWNEMLKLSKYVTHISFFSLMKKEVGFEEFEIPKTPHCSQIQLLITSLQNHIQKAKEFIDHFTDTIFQDILRLFSTKDESIKSINDKISLLEETDTKEYSVLQYFPESVGKTILLKLDRFFTSYEKVVKEFSTVKEVEVILFRLKLDAMRGILSSFSVDEDFEIFNSFNLYLLHQKIVKYVQKYVNSIIKEVTFPTMEKLLQFWNVKQRSSEICEKLFQEETERKKFVDSSNGHLKTLLNSQRAFDEERFNCYIYTIRFEYLSSVKQELSRKIKQNEWGQKRKELLKRITVSADQFLKATTQLKQSYGIFNQIEKKVITKLTWLRDFPQISKKKNPKSIVSPGKTLKVIKSRRSAVAKIFANDDIVISFVKDVLSLEKFCGIKDEKLEKLEKQVTLYCGEWKIIKEKVFSYNGQLNDLKMKLYELSQKEHNIQKQLPLVKKRMEVLEVDVKETKKVLTPQMEENKSTLLNIRKEEIASYYKILDELRSLIDSLIRVTKNYKGWNNYLGTIKTFFVTHKKEVNDIFELWGKRLTSADEILCNMDDKCKISEVIKGGFQVILKHVAHVNEKIQNFNQNEIDEEEEEEEIEKLGQSHAVKVIRRVGQRLSTSVNLKDKVRGLINEATSHDNLSRMYVGWLPFL